MRQITCTLERTQALGRLLAKAMVDFGPFDILLEGPLGSGKTSLTSALVYALPGGEQAEFSSPSFTVCNIYETEPELLHCDLYRSGSNSRLPEEVEDLLEDGGRALVLEWADYLAKEDLPKDALRIVFEDTGKEGDAPSRLLSLSASGKLSARILSLIPEEWNA